MVLRESVIFNEKNMDSVLSVDLLSSTKTFENALLDPNILLPESPLPEPLMNHHHLAALKVQKTYKSFRTRRQLADCAILVEHRWLVTRYPIFYLFADGTNVKL